MSGPLELVLSWLTIHTIHTLRYARLYYTGKDGGVDFNQKVLPCYLDFAYISFTVGMTFPVSDTNIVGGAIRAAILKQALLSYVVGRVILAPTVDLVVGLGK